ncbi:MAG: ABC transporter ATP-binding protein [Verrucomicrobiota bacterium]
MQNYSRLILRYARPYWRSFALIFILTLAASALAALQPWPMKVLVDNVLGGKALPPFLENIFRTFSFQSDASRLLTLVALGGVVFFALNSIFDAALAWSWTLAGRKTVYALSEDIFARLQRRSLLYHVRNAVGDSMGRVTVDSWVVYRVLAKVFFAPAHALVMLGVMIFLMAQLNVLLTWLTLAIAPLMTFGSLLLGKRLRAVAQVRREIENRIQSHIQQTLTGIPVVQAFAQEDREHMRFQQFADAAIRAQQRSAVIESVNSLSSGLIAAIGTAFILWAGANQVVAGKLTLGSLLVFLVYLNSLQSQVKVFAEIYTEAQKFHPNVTRIREILDVESEVAEKPNAISIAARGHVKFENVVFAYETGNPVLNGVSLEVRPGEILAIVGATGAGKTTLVNLVPRFYDPSAGRILLDGQDIRDLKVQNLRDQVALVLQEPFLFPFSIAENISYGRPSASRHEIEAAARTANAHEFIVKLPQGYDTHLGERGATLSGGERQRLSIARALLKNAPVLILDEPTSALDVETEGLILEALERLMAGRSTFIIAHRLSTVRRANRIVVLQDGKIAESGTHDELMAHGKLYAHFHNVQFVTNENAATGGAPS